MRNFHVSESTKIQVLEEREVQVAEDEKRQRDWGQMMKSLVCLARKLGFDSIG